MRRWVPMAGVVVLLCGFVLALQLMRATDESAGAESVVAAVPAPSPAHPMAPVRRETPPSEPGLEPPRPSGPARAHARAAEALGLVAIRCHVGSQLDATHVTGGFEPRITDGWYSTMVTTLQGSQLVYGRDPGDAPEAAQPLFTVHWVAQEPGTSVPCRLEWLDYAEIEVTLVDGDGGAVEGVTVSGCGAFAEVTGPDGKARGQVVVSPRCTLFALTSFGGERGLSMARLDVFDLKVGEVRRVGLELVEMEDPTDFATTDDDTEYLLDPASSADQMLGHAVAVRGLLRDAQGSEAAVLTRLADQLENRADQKQVMDEMQADLQGLEAAVEDGDFEQVTETVERSQALMEELEALWDEASREPAR